ncbi:MAG: hypothetical protein H6686_09585 [Fibrobacteria bacterium]|nr:hypothetical protein [Fibrobacteria bacterium]
MRKVRVEAARRQVAEFLAGADRRVILDIAGMSHRETCGLLYGGPLRQLLVGWRYLASLSLYICPFAGLKVLIYRLMGMRIGRNVYIAPGVYLDIVHPKLLEIGDDVVLGMGVSVVTHERSGRTMTLGRVSIGKGAVVGGLSLVRAGVRIGAGAEIDSMLNIARSVKAGEIVASARNGKAVPSVPDGGDV